MPNHSERKSILIILSVFSFVVFGTYAVTLIARGYRPSLQPNGLTINATGLLSATSKPKGASVYINNSLITATDDTINLSPGNYLVKIVKDGYLTWQKNIEIKKEIVYQTDAQLFRSNPDLKPLTQTGAINPIISPDFTKIIYSVASASASTDNGLYLIALSSNILSLNSNVPQQITPNTPSLDWSKATITFSPNGTEILASFKTANTNYLFNLNSTFPIKTLSEVTPKLPIISKEWAAQDKTILASKIELLPKEIKTVIASSSASQITYSPNNDKVLYLATTNSQLPDQIITPPPAKSTQSQTRKITQGNYYVYNIKDDTNFQISQSTNLNRPFWLQNSDNLIYVNQQSIVGIDYDNTNMQTLFTGIIKSDEVFPMPDGNRIIVLTSAFTNSAPNLYAITIR